MLKKIVIITITVAATVYLALAVFLFNAPQKGAKCQGTEIVIFDNDMQTMSIEEVEKQLKKSGLDPTGKIMDEIVSEEIEKTLKKISIIERCQCFKTHKNKIGIHITCKQPIIHVFDQKGGEYYLDKNSEIIKSVQSAIYLPIASGEIKGEETMKDLVKIALYLQENRFWREQVEQIHVTPKQEIILIPRIGNHLIELGKADNLENKLSKLKEFYKEGLNKIGWNKYKKLNIEFDKQVICTKKEQ